MNNWYILILMFFAHIVDDYYLQAGLLSSLKQKIWWKEHAPNKMYKYDYIVGLIMHSFSWAFMIMLPIAWFYSFNPPTIYIVLLFINMTIHAIVDDVKANKLKINLVTDQTIHVLQMFVTWIVMVL